MLDYFTEDFAKSFTKVSKERNKEVNNILCFKYEFIETTEIGGLI
ncbi:hypothetical protein [Clostridium sp. 1001275B_160808_H3]|nr:hypothetical protein [Clostridium sp. 1001275B_160808_H3]